MVGISKEGVFRVDRQLEGQVMKLERWTGQFQSHGELPKDPEPRVAGLNL